MSQIKHHQIPLAVNFFRLTLMGFCAGHFIAVSSDFQGTPWDWFRMTVTVVGILYLIVEGWRITDLAIDRGRHGKRTKWRGKK